MKTCVLCYLWITVFFFPQMSRSQVGGNAVYKFLEIPVSPKNAATGGYLISLKDSDLTLSIANPALLGSETKMNLTYINYISDINLGNVAVSIVHGKYGNLAASLQYINYGKFTEANERGIKLGTFSAAEYCFQIIGSKKLDSLFWFGFSTKIIYSSFYTYHSAALLFDVGLYYRSRNGLFSSGMVLKNMGYQIKPYYEGSREPMPVDVQLGFSQKLAHAPFRIHVTAKNLLTPDLVYDFGKNSQQNGEIYLPASEKSELSENIFRHLVFAVDFVPSRNFYFTLGYNHQRRKELKIDTKTGTAGYSWGFGARISTFSFSYARAKYHLAGASNHFSVTFDI